MRLRQGVGVIAVAISLVACSSKPPKQYIAPTISTGIAMPANADLSDSNAALQKALNERQLYLTTEGEAAPYETSGCRSELLKRVSSPQGILPGEDPLYGGYLLPVQVIGQSVHYQNEAGRAVPLRALPNTQSALYLDFSGLGGSDLGGQWMAAIASLQANIVLSDGQWRALKKTGFAEVSPQRIFVKRAPLLRRPEPANIGAEYLFNETLSQPLVAIGDNPLGMCQSLRDSVFISSSTLPYQQGRGYLPSQLVSMLPQNADFNQLDKQVELAKQGRYLTFWGKRAVLQDRCKTGELGEEVCGKGSSKTTRERSGAVVVIGGGQGDR